MFCNYFLPIQLSMYQIDWAIIKSIGLMSNRMTIMLWTIIHDTLRTDSSSFSKTVRTTTRTLSCQMFKSMVFYGIPRGRVDDFLVFYIDQV